MRKLWILLALLLTACQTAQPVEDTAAPGKAETITCSVAYRSDVTQGIEREERLVFAEGDSKQLVNFANMDFYGEYFSGNFDGERSLRLWVTPASSDAVIHSQLYQLEQTSGPVNQFVGGHGFTGLGYAYHPDSTAELQYWCVAE